MVTVGETATQVAVFDETPTLLAVRDDPGLGAQAIDTAVRRWIDLRLAGRNPALLVEIAGTPADFLRGPIRIALTQLEREPSAALPIGSETLSLTLADVETLLAPEISRLSHLVHATVDAAGPGRIDGIYPLGELARIPPTLRALARFGPLLAMDPRVPAAASPTAPRRNAVVVVIGAGALVVAAIVAVVFTTTRSHPTVNSQPAPSSSAAAGPSMSSGLVLPPGYGMSPGHCGTLIGLSIPISDDATSLAVDPGTHRLFVAGDHGVTIIDTTTNTVRNTLPLPRSKGIGIDEVLHRAYVTGFSDDPSYQDVVTTIDTTTGTVVGQSHAGGVDAFGIESVAVDESSHLVYLGDGYPQLTVFDPAANSARAITLDGQPHAVAVDSNTHRVYTVDSKRRSLMVVDPAAGTTVATVSIDPKPGAYDDVYYVAVDSDLKRVYLYGGDLVVTIDTTTNSIIATANVRSGDGIAVDHGGHTVYFTDRADCSVWSMMPSDGTTASLAAPIGGQLVPSDIAVDPDGHAIYVLNDKAVSVIHH